MNTTSQMRHHVLPLEQKNRFHERNVDTSQNFSCWTQQGKTHIYLAGRYQALVALGTLDTSPKIPFQTKLAIKPKPYIQILKGMKVAECSTVPPLWPDSNIEEDKLNRENFVKINRAPRSKQLKIDQLIDTKQQEPSFQKSQRTETVQISEKIHDYKPLSMKMMRQVKSMWHGHLGQIADAKPLINLDPPDAPYIFTAIYRAGVMQRETEGKKVSKMQEAGMNEPEIVEWASPIVLVPKRETDILFYLSTIALFALLQNAIAPHLKHGWVRWSAGSDSNGLQLAKPSWDSGNSTWTATTITKQW